MAKESGSPLGDGAHVIDLGAVGSTIQEHWHPKVIASLNGQQVKLAKIEGEFVWHYHEHADELFMPIEGVLSLEFRDRTVDVRPGQFFVVPRGVEHRPVAKSEVLLLLFEPAGTLNTGNLGDHPLTVIVD